MGDLCARLVGVTHRLISLSCAPLGQDRPFHPFIDQLAWAAGFERGESAEVRRDKLRHVLQAPHGAEALVLLADLLSIATEHRAPPLALAPQERRQRIATALISEILAAAARTPLLLVVEDLHWIDPTSREVLESLLERMCDLPVLAVLTSRPECAPNWPAAIPVETMVLNRLDKADVAALVVATGGSVLSADVRQSIIERADGIPLYIEELTRMVVESGGELSSPRLPASLQGSLLARLDRLKVGREVAQIGAVIGRSFDHALISALTPILGDTLALGLTELVNSGLASRRGTPPLATYTFKHALVQDAAYESLLRSRRAEIHRRIVEALVAQEPGIEVSRPDLLAHHCDHAGRTAEAVEHYIRAGAQSLDRGAFPEARKQFSRALHQCAGLTNGEARADAEIRALDGLCTDAEYRLGFGSSEAGRLATRQVELCALVNNPLDHLSAFWALWVFRLNRGNYAGALEVGESLTRSGEERDDIRGCIVGHFCSGAVQTIRGELSAGRSSLEQCIEMHKSWQSGPTACREKQEFLTRGVPMNNGQAWLALAICWNGFPERALAYVGAALKRSELAGYGRTEIFFHMARLRILMFLFRPPELAELVGELLRRSNDLGTLYFGGVAAILNGYAIAYHGDPVAGGRAISEGLAVYGSVLLTGHFRALLAETQQMQGDLDGSLSTLTETLHSMQRTGERWCEAELMRRIGETHRMKGDSDQAARLFKQAISIARSQGARLWELRATASLAQLLDHAGRRSEAYAILHPIYSWFTEGFDTTPLQDAKAVLDHLDGARG